MQPRLKYSSKWTPIPAELAQQITELFSENFSSYLAGGVVVVEGRIYLKEVLFRLGYRAKNELRQANFEISVEYDRNKDNMVKMIHVAVDCAASMMESYFTEEAAEFPLSWEKFDFSGRPIYLQFSSTNTELESEADRLLGIEAEGNLMRGDDIDEDLTEEELDLKISMLGLEDEDFPEEKPPTKTTKKTAKKSRN